jgi:hypothetical protein
MKAPLFRFFLAFIFTSLNLQLVFAQGLSAKDTVRVPSFLLVSRAKTVRVDSGDYLQLRYKHVALEHDSVQRSVDGFFAFIKGDSIGMTQFDETDMIYYCDSIKLKRKVKLHSKLFLNDTVHMYCLSKVDRMVTENNTFEGIMATGFGLSLLSALVVSPIVSIHHGHADWAEMGKISGISILAATGFIAGSLYYWPRYHELRGDIKTSKKVYRLRRLYKEPWLQE